MSDPSSIDPARLNGDPAAPTLPPRAEAPTLAPAPVPLSSYSPLVPGYEMVRELGRGGMGVVYEARQVALNRIVALKMILAGGHASAADLDRFRAEAEAVARLLHPNIVQVYETGTHAGLPYFSLEFCPGSSLDRKLDGTPWEPAPAAALVETLARAIQHAHDRGIVHRDRKPANILRAADGTPKVTDFGLAKRLDSKIALSQPGAILGTPSYMAPEQAGDGPAVGPPADVYALSAMLYELLTGRPPFRAATHLDTIVQVVSDEPVPPTRLNPKTPRDLETICLKCLAKEPAKRYASAAALAEDLRLGASKSPDSTPELEPVNDAQKRIFWMSVRLRFFEDDRVLVTYPTGTTLWKLDDAAPIAQARFETTGFFFIFLGRAAEMSPARVGDTVAVLRAGDVQLWELPDSAGGHIARTSLDFSSPDGFRRVPLADLEAGAPGRVQASGDRPISQAVLSPDGKWLVTYGNGRLRAWDVASGAKHGEAEDVERSVLGLGLAVTADGKTLKAVDSDTIRLFSLPELQLVHTVPRLRIGHGRYEFGVSPHVEHTYLVEGMSVATYDHQPPQTVRPDTPPVPDSWSRSSIDLAASGPLVGVDEIKGAVVWDNGRSDTISIGQSVLIPLRVMGVAVAPSGLFAVSDKTGFFGTTLTVYDLTTRKVTGEPIDLRHPKRGAVRTPSTMAITPDGRTLVAQTEHGPLVVDMLSRKVVRALGNPGSFTSRPVFTPDSRAALFAWPATHVWVLVNLADGAILVRAPNGLGETPVGFSPDGTLLVSSDVRKLILRDGATLEPVGEIAASVDDLGTGALAPDGRLIVTGGLDGHLRIWDVKRREGLIAVDLAAGPIRKLVFTPDGRKVRFLAQKRVGELDLHAYEPYVEGNLTWNLLRLLPALDRTEADRVLNRLRESHPEVYRAGVAAFNTKEATNVSPK
jgi:serine/threonine protein kinase/WD40 repeat protein